MTTWTLGDAIISSGGHVEGTGPTARTLRGLFECVPSQVAIIVGSPPGQRVRVDLNSDWMLDRWLRERGIQEGLSCFSEYVPKPEDIPPELRRIVGDAKPSAKAKAGRAA